MDESSWIIALFLSAIVLIIFYAIIKAAVKNGILEADFIRENKKREQEKKDLEKANTLQNSIDSMTKRITSILAGNNPTLYLYGSATLNDFRLGWSDIDILCLTKSEISQDQANKLVMLRQTLLEEFPSNEYFRSFEGGFLTEKAFIEKTPDRVVYWGTSGQKITEKHYFDSFAMVELKDSGKVLFGEDRRNLFPYPNKEQVIVDVKKHYEAIRKYAQTTSRNIMDTGWMLDIARGLYTLKTGKIATKTAAGEWAIENNLVPDVKVMKRVLEIRKYPKEFKNDKATLDWVVTLGPHIQKFADVLEKELEKTEEI